MSDHNGQDLDAGAVAPGNHEPVDWARVVQQHVQSLRFGSVQVVVHDGRVVSVERIEKFRFPYRPTPAS